MNKGPTPEQVAASRGLGEAFLRFLLAVRPDPPKVEKPAPPPQPLPERPPQAQAAWPFVPPKEVLPVQPLLISAREAAALLSISARTVWALSSPRGPIPAVRVGRIVRYSVEDLTEWVKQARKRGAKP